MGPDFRNLIGRARELEELESGLTETEGGIGGLFALVGEPGIGKTRLAVELGRRAEARGFTVHWGRCWEAGGAPAFWPWIQILRSMLRDVRCKPVANAYGDVLARLLPELRKENGGGVALRELDQAEARFQLFDEVWVLLRALAEQVPVLLVVDDLHAADPSSLALLRFIVRDLRNNRVVVVVTYRDREAKPTADVSDAIQSIAREGTFLPLRRLSADEVSELLDDRAGKPVARELASALHKTTEGNPMFVDQVYRMLEARDALEEPPSALPIPEGIREVIRRQLVLIDGPTRSVLDAAAAFGREFTRSLLAAVSGNDEPSLRAPLKHAMESGIIVEPVLGSYEFSHALFREALYRDLPSKERALYHARAADALERSNAPDKGLGEVAQHLVLAVSVVGAERATEGSMRAGRRALDALAFEDAATILSQVIKEVGPSLRDEKLRCRVLVMLGEARARMGDGDGARRACEEAATIARGQGEPSLVAEAALALGVELLPGVVSTALVALLEEALEALPTAPTSLRARVLARLAAALQPSSNPEQPISFAREALAMARTLGDDATLRACLHMGGSALVDFADPVERCAWDGELLRLSTQTDDVIATLRAHVRLFFDYLEIGLVAEADAHLEEHQRLADRVGLRNCQWLTLMMRALRAIWDGRFVEAIDLREQARRVGQRILTPEMEMTTHLQGWGLALARGEPLPQVERVAVLGARFPASQFMGMVVRSFEEFRRGDRETARSVLAQIPEDSPALSCAGPHLRFLAETCTRLDDRARAMRLDIALRESEERMVSCGRVGMYIEGPTGWLLGMLAGVLGQFEEAARYFEDALRRSSRSGMRPYEAIICLEYARMLAGRGPAHDERQTELVRHGRAIAQELGMSGVLRALDDLSGTRAETKSEPPAAAPAGDVPTVAPPFSLRKDGEVWAVESGHATFRVKDSRGMQMLAELVSSPNHESHVLTLMASEMSDAGDGGEMIDREAREAYRERVDDLRDQLQEAEAFGDPVRALRLRTELERIMAELARGVGLGGRQRRAGAAAERARINVQRRVREAIRRIGEQDAKLGRHLDRAVRTGTFCAYEPD